MAAKSGRLDYWRNYFRSADSDIFEVIEYAIVVAASDCPTEFRIRRDGIAEKLFACKFARCTGCDQVELAVPEEEEDGGELKSKFGGSGGSEAGGSGCKDSKMNSSTDEAGEQNQVSNMSYNEGNISYNEVEALTEEIEEKNVTVGEVLRIKEIMENYQAQSDGILFESLRRLQLMELSVGTLKMTEIGKAVNGVRKHASKQIRHLSRTLINEWKDMVDVWVNATAEIAGSSPDSVNPSVVDDGGLPSPPLDEGAFLAAHSTIELSQFFDGMDDDGNIQNSGELERKHKSERKPTFENHAPNRKPQNPREDNARKENQTQMRKQEPINKQSKPSNADLNPWRPVNPTLENKSNRGNPKFQQRSDAEKIQKKPLNGSQDKSKSADEMLSRLEATKRRLHEGYQQAENAKKQRTIQVMELHDLPKQGLSHRNFHPKPGSHNRHFSNGRR